MLDEVGGTQSKLPLLHEIQKMFFAITQKVLL